MVARPASPSPAPSPPLSEGLPSPLTSNSDSIGPPLSDSQSLSDWIPSDHSDFESDAADDVESDYDMLASWRGSHSSISGRSAHSQAPPSDFGSEETNRSTAEPLRFPDPMASMSDESTATLIPSLSSLTNEGSYTLIDGPEITSEPPPSRLVPTVDGTDRSENVKTWLHSTVRSSKINDVDKLKQDELARSILERSTRPPNILKDRSEMPSVEASNTPVDRPATPALLRNQPSTPIHIATQDVGEPLKKKLEELCRPQRPRVISSLGLVLAGAFVLVSSWYARTGSQPISAAPSTSTLLPISIPVQSSATFSFSTSTRTSASMPSATPVQSCSMTNPAACALALVDVRTSLATLTNPFNGKPHFVVNRSDNDAGAPRLLPSRQKKGSKRYARQVKREKRCGLKKKAIPIKSGKRKELTLVDAPLDATMLSSQATFKEALDAFYAASRDATRRASLRFRSTIKRAHFIDQLSRKQYSHLHHWSASHYQQLLYQSTAFTNRFRHAAGGQVQKYSLTASRAFRDLIKPASPHSAYVQEAVWKPWKHRCYRAAHSLKRMKHGDYRVMQKHLKRLERLKHLTHLKVFSCDHVDGKTRLQKACQQAEKFGKSWSVIPRQLW